MSVTIEDLLGASAEKIASMSDDELREYLKDIIKLEPQVTPSPLSSSSSNNKDKEEEKDSCPIKSAKKKKKKLSGNELLEKLAKDIEIPQTRVSQIIKGNRRITADTALRLSKYFGNSAKFWLGLQDDFDIEEETSAKGSILKSIRALEANVTNGA